MKTVTRALIMMSVLGLSQVSLARSQSSYQCSLNDSPKQEVSSFDGFPTSRFGMEFTKGHEISATIVADAGTGQNLTLEIVTRSALSPDNLFKVSLDYVVGNLRGTPGATGVPQISSSFVDPNSGLRLRFSCY